MGEVLLGLYLFVCDWSCKVQSQTCCFPAAATAPLHLLRCRVPARGGPAALRALRPASCVPGADGRHRSAGLGSRPPAFTSRLPERHGQVSASLPHFCPARRRGCLRSVVTCHCRSRSFIKLCLLSAPAPPVLPFAGGRALGVNWFCAEGSRGGRERRVPLCRAQLSLVGKRGLLRAPRLCCRPGLRPGPLFPTRVRGGEAPAERSCFFALQGARGARATGSVLGGRAPLPPAWGSRRPPADLCPLGNPALFPAPPGLCLAGSLCHAAA